MIKAQTWSTAPNLLPPNRRRYLRVELAVQVELRSTATNVPIRLETSDLSLGGCYVEMATTLDIGTKLNVVLWLDHQKVITKGVVATRHAQFGNGIQFFGMSPEDACTLGCFLDARGRIW